MIWKQLLWACCMAAITSTSATAAGWLCVQSAHFTIVGDASESQMEQAAAGLERFLSAISVRLPSPSLQPSNSLLVYLLKDAASYDPFRVEHDGIPANEPGYFIPSRELNFIAATATGSDTQRILYHELFHALYRSENAPLPAWLSEGLADYYSTFDTGTGDPIPEHLQTLRENSWIPVKDLLLATHDSPFYKEAALKEKFYAESWLLVHFFLSSSSPSQAIDSLKALLPANIGDLDNSLREYAAKLPQKVKAVPPLESIVAPADGITTSTLSQSEAATYSGILLLHLDRIEPAERELNFAINSEPPSPAAFTWLGALRLRQNRNVEASGLLNRAIQSDTEDPFAHFVHSVALNAIAATETASVRTELLETSRVHFERAIELAPWMFDAYLWLAKVSIALEDYARTERILGIAIEAYPDRKELGAALLEIQDSEAAHQEREAVIREKSRREHLAAALSLLRLNAPEVTVAAVRPTEFLAGVAINPAKTTVRKPTFEGSLSMIDCRKGITLVVRNAEKVVNFHTDTPLHLEFTSKTSNAANEAACGPVYPEHRVVVTYIPRNSTVSKGEPIRIFYKD